ncbi:MAG: tRNA pseudouridine(55) synthase TruB [Acidimicrobiia bacterium]
MTVEGFLLVDKPGGPTSHDVVAAVRKATGQRRAGHAGTLDPMASGLVVVAMGRATRLVRFVQDLPKEYEAVARFGIATDSLDADGEVTWSHPAEIDEAELKGVARRFVGTIDQVPPMVSALKVQGRRLYDLAREGREVRRAPRPIEIHALEILEVGRGPHPDVRFRVTCGKGTYVRVLADDLAGGLGTRAHLVALRRTRTGSLDVGERGVSLEAVRAGRWEAGVLTPAEGLGDLPAAEVRGDVEKMARHGRRLEPSPAPGLAAGTAFRILDESGWMLAVYRSGDADARPEVVIA